MLGFLALSESTDVLPVIHGSGDFAVRVRESLLAGGYDCVAVPLPGSLAEETFAAVELLPSVSAVLQPQPDGASASYVPIDPCQPVIAAIRTAKRERIAVEFIDLETEVYEPHEAALPDPYALKRLPVEKFVAAVLPVIPRPAAGSQLDRRVRRMAFELHRLELEYKRILFVPSVLDWPWIREAYVERRDYPEHERFFSPIRAYSVSRRTLTFFLGELPFVTALYERSRQTLDSDENLSIDGVKALVLEARDRWKAQRDGDREWLSPKLLSIFMQYVRNLTLFGRRLSPDLYTLVAAAKQIGGDGFARTLLDTAREYPFSADPSRRDVLKMGVGRGERTDAGPVRLKSRLSGVALVWRTLELSPEPPQKKAHLWKILWDPYGQCSWPPEDQRIESFHTHVREQAKALLGQDLARVEKFTTSVKDGIDVRETLRHWHKGEIYVKEIPPSRGGLEIVVMLFDVPADPDKYPWRTTWHAEHSEESTLGFFATDFRREMVGPGIGKARYGGVMFLYPPRMIPDVWSDPRLPVMGSLEERLLAAAVLHSQEPHVAVVCPGALRLSWRQLARARGKKLIHLPLARFSGRMLDRLRTVHVLNGKEIRSFAAHFIRGE